MFINIFNPLFEPCPVGSCIDISNLSFFTNFTGDRMIRFTFLFVLIFSVIPSDPQWSNDPNINNAICAAVQHQYTPQIVSDGAGGAIITWKDLRTGANYDIYAQRINSSGVTQWSVVGGVPICVYSGYQNNPKLAGDGSGGALPITLSSFTAQIDPSQMSMLLKWKTVTEVNNYGFEVELFETSTKHWKKVGFV